MTANKFKKMKMNKKKHRSSKFNQKIQKWKEGDDKKKLLNTAAKKKKKKQSSQNKNISIASIRNEQQCEMQTNGIDTHKKSNDKNREREMNSEY